MSSETIQINSILGFLKFVLNGMMSLYLASDIKLRFLLTTLAMFGLGSDVVFGIPPHEKKFRKYPPQNFRGKFKKPEKTKKIRLV